MRKAITQTYHHQKKKKKGVYYPLTHSQVSARSMGLRVYVIRESISRPINGNFGIWREYFHMWGSWGAGPFMASPLSRSSLSLSSPSFQKPP